MKKEVPIMKKLRKKTLEGITYNMFRKSPTGKFLGNLYFLVGIGSFFLYWKILDLYILISILLGILTWVIILGIMDRVVIKLFRIDKTIDFLKTPEGIERLKKIGKYSDEEVKVIKKQIEEIEKEINL